MKITKDPAEQTTAATDIILAFVVSGGIFFLRWPELYSTELWKINIWSVVLGLIGVAATLGAIAHGLVLSQKLQQRIWLVLNLALALAASLFVVGAIYDLWGFTTSLNALPIMLISGLGFYLATVLYPGIFFLFTVYAALSLIFALGAYALLAIQGELKGAGLMTAGILISIIATVIQTKKSAMVTIIWKFDHNGIYHLVQAIGLFFLCAGLRSSLIG